MNLSVMASFFFFLQVSNHFFSPHLLVFKGALCNMWPIVEFMLQTNTWQHIIRVITN